MRRGLGVRRGGILAPGPFLGVGFGHVGRCAGEGVLSARDECECKSEGPCRVAVDIVSE
jgi:hypothetical protein